MSKIAYMFHAIGELDKEDWADTHYCFSVKKFMALTEKLVKVTSFEQALSNGDSNISIFTFDDGHVSNYSAAKYLYENKLGTAEFFINPEKVSSPYYMSWDQIRELSDWGMSIQSHGLDHKFLTECDDVELKKQLQLSKELIEENISKKVTLLAPPGGRYDQRIIDVAKSCGYKFILMSEPGHINSMDEFLIPRMAVLNMHSVEDLVKMRSRLSLLNIKNKVKYKFLYVIKQIIGNSRYEKIRWAILGGKA